MSNARGRIPDVNWGRNMWDRIKSLFDGVKSDVSNLDDRVEALEEGGSGEENVIEAISFNGTNVPPDANKRVSMTETDPTVPNWAKQSTKPSYTATEVGALPANTTYVSGVKGNAESSYRQGNVNLTPANIGALPDTTPIPGKTSDLINDSGFLTAQTGVTGVKGSAESAFRSGDVALSAEDVAALAKGNYNMSAADTGGLNRMFAGIDITQADNGIPGLSKQGQILAAMDSNSRRFFLIRSVVSGNGDIDFRVGCYNHDGTDTISVYGNVVISKDGTVAFTFSHPDEIKQALDIIEATTTQAGLMSAADKTKLDGITPGGSVTGVKGNAEANYRTGNVNLTPANIGALPDTTPIPGKTSDLINDSGFLTAQTGVTGVKGNEESSYRQGNVNLTPANIGAVAKAGDTMTGPLTVQSDGIILTDPSKGNLSLYMHISGPGNFGIYSNGYYNGSSFVSDGKWLVYRDTNDVIRLGNAVPVNNGGTGATTPAGARANLGIQSGSRSDYFNGGSLTFPFSAFGLNSRPNTLVMTPGSEDVFIRYDWDNSASNILLFCHKRDGTPQTGYVRYSWIAIP